MRTEYFEILEEMGSNHTEIADIATEISVADCNIGI